jgi:hypothetical protein
MRKNKKRKRKKTREQHTYICTYMHTARMSIAKDEEAQKNKAQYTLSWRCTIVTTQAQVHVLAESRGI